MKYLLQGGDYICRIKTKDYDFEAYLVGFLEQEPDLFKFKNCILTESFITMDEIKEQSWESLFLNLETLQRILNDLTNTHYNTKDRLYRDQIYAIKSKLYSQCVLDSIINEGVTKEQAELIISESYDRGHSAGYSEVVSYCFDYIDFVKKIIETLKK